MGKRTLKISLASFLLVALTGLALAGTVSAADDTSTGNNPSPTVLANLPNTDSQGLNASSDFNLPQIGEAGADAISLAEEYRIGVQVMNELRDAGALVEDPQIEQYIQDLGHQLSSHSDNPSLNFGFYVIDDDTINATTLPGGFIVVNSGTILAADSEDELAGVVAHEIGHVTQRHLARGLEDEESRSLINLATMLGAILAATKTNDPDVAMGSLATAQASIIQHQINYTRGDEAEADRVGIATLARAGFPPDGMVDFFAKMQQNSSLNGYDRIPEFLLDHPLDLSRMADLKNRAEQLHVPPRRDSRSFALMKARLKAQQNDSLDSLLGYFKAGVQSTKGWDQVAMRYGLALVQQRAGQRADAIATLRDLSSKYDDVTAFRIGLADAEMQSGDTASAISTYQAAMRLFPDSTPLVLSYGGDLIDSGRPQDAIALLTPLLPTQLGGPDVVRLMAKAYDKGGDSADSHYYMSEYYLATGLPSAAVDQLRIALATPGINSIQKERYRARLHRVEEAAKEARRDKQDQP